MGRPKGSLNKKNVLATTNTVVKGGAEIVEKIINGEYAMRRLRIWKNIPSDLVVNELTPVGSRLLYAESPETRYFLKRYIPAGAHDPINGQLFPNGGVIAESKNLDYPQYLRPESIMVHESKAVTVAIPEEFKYHTGGHREGSAAAEKAAIKAMKKKAKQDKIDAKMAKKQAKIDAKQAKIDAKNAKKRARLEKKEAKEKRKQTRLAKQEKKAKRAKSTAKTASAFLDLKNVVKKKLKRK